MLKKIGRISACVALLLSSTSTNAIILDFEDLQDLELVTNQYISDGVSFNNAISLTAGFSLNEFDFPPHSGNVAIGDNFKPLELSFSSAANKISGYFTYGSQLTFSAYDSLGGLIGEFINAGFDNFGMSELIELDFIDVSSLVITGEWDGSFILDDLSFEVSSGSVPEPSTLVLFSLGIIGFKLLNNSKNLTN